jgi:large subunit ribosomal protein L4
MNKLLDRVSPQMMSFSGKLLPVLMKSIGSCNRCVSSVVASRELNVDFPPNVRFDKTSLRILKREKSQEEVPEAFKNSIPSSLPIYSFTNGNVTSESMEIPLEIFDTPLRPDIIHRVIVWQEKNARTTLYKTKTRSEVKGGGKKPWRQKGTGMARAGSTRSPIWVGGGVAHGPVLRDWSIKLNKKVRALGLRIALGAKIREGNIKVVDDFFLDKKEVDGPSKKEGENENKVDENESSISLKTKQVSSLLLSSHQLNVEKDRVLFIDGTEVPRSFDLASRNLKRAYTMPSIGVNVRDVILSKSLVVTKEGMEQIIDRLARYM